MKCWCELKTNSMHAAKQMLGFLRGHSSRQTCMITHIRWKGHCKTTGEASLDNFGCKRIDLRLHVAIKRSRIFLALFSREQFANLGGCRCSFDWLQRFGGRGKAFNGRDLNFPAIGICPGLRSTRTNIVRLFDELPHGPIQVCRKRIKLDRVDIKIRTLDRL